MLMYTCFENCVFNSISISKKSPEIEKKHRTQMKMISV